MLRVSWQIVSGFPFFEPPEANTITTTTIPSQVLDPRKSRSKQSYLWQAKSGFKRGLAFLLLTFSLLV